MDREMATRLWAIATILRSGHPLGFETMNKLGEACDDIAMVLAKQAGTSYDEVCEDAEKETFTPTYKFSKQ